MKIRDRQLRGLILEACGCGGGSPEPEVVDTDAGDVVDVDFQDPDYGHDRGNIDDMNPRDAFITGFVMGQSGDFDEIMRDRGETPELAIGEPTVPEADIEEELIDPVELTSLMEAPEFASSDDITQTLLNALSAEGGSTDMSTLRDSLVNVPVPDNFDLESFLTNSDDISRHPEGDYIAGQVTETYTLPARPSLGAAFVEIEPILIGASSSTAVGLNDVELWAKLAGIE